MFLLIKFRIQIVTMFLPVTLRFFIIEDRCYPKESIFSDTFFLLFSDLSKI